MADSRFDLPADSPDGQWLNSAPFYIFYSLLIALYALSGVYYQPLHAMLDSVVTPVVSSLALVHLTIVPITKGPLSASLYLNLSGLSVIGALSYNLVLLAWMIKNKRTAALNCVAAHERLMARKHWGRTRTWITLHACVYAGLWVFVAFGVFGLLNGVCQWVGFIVDGDDAISLTLIPIFFFMFGTVPVYFCSVYVKYIIFDGEYLIKRYRDRVIK